MSRLEQYNEIPKETLDLLDDLGLFRPNWQKDIAVYHKFDALLAQGLSRYQAELTIAYHLRMTPPAITKVLKKMKAI